MTKLSLMHFFQRVLERKLSQSGYNYCINLFTISQLTEVPDESANKIIFVINELADKKASAIEERYLSDILKKVLILEESFEYYEVYQGVDVQYQMTLDAGEDWSGFAIVARLDETGEPMSALDNLGTGATQQAIAITDIGDNITPTTRIAKVKITLESLESGQASGDAIAVVAEFYLTLKQEPADAVS